MSDNVDLIYIAGIGHSGSTILGMKLGCEEHRFFLGEAKHFDVTYNKHKCTCGKSLESCPYWSNLNMSNWHKLLKRAQEVKKKDVSELVDSSKDPSVLNRRIKNPNLNVNVIHLVRNPFNHLKKYGFKAFLSWFISHTATYILCKIRSVPYRMISYNQLINSEERYDKKIRDEEYHIFTGNIPVVNNFSKIEN